jgi:hypothetical protein
VKLYKFRPLADNTDFDRLKEILETGQFWCSKFQDLNDPMEGVYRFLNYTERRARLINLIFGEKASYKICSFSNKKAFSNPIMWGYYANGFRGVAIEIEVYRFKINKIKYEDEIQGFEGSNPNIVAKRILTTKLSMWEHEYEYRLLEQSERNKIKIGNITGLYFGDPYEIAHNRNNIVEDSNNIREYLKNKKRILDITRQNNIAVHSVSIEDNEVIKVNPQE